MVRESNEYDLMAFGTMIRQVLEPLVGRVLGADEVLELCGEDALVMRLTPQGESLRERWGARVLSQGAKPYGYVFEVSGTQFFFAMTSAFSEAAEDLTNAFTEDLIDAVRICRPRHLYTGPSTRLVRRKDLGERLGRELGLLEITVHTKEAPEGIDPGRNPGSMSWTLLCMQAESDLRTTVTRLLTGRIFAMKKNYWLAGPGSLPLGFRLESDSANRLVVGDAQEVLLARRMLALAATAGDQLGRSLQPGEARVDAAAIVLALSAQGATKRSHRKFGKQGAPIAGEPLQSSTEPKQAVLSMLKVLAAYSDSGVLVRRQELPMAGLNKHDVHGMTIFKPTTTDESANYRAKGSLLFQWTFPKPKNTQGDDEPWANAEQLDQAGRYLAHLVTARTDEVSVLTRRPFCGLFKAEHEGSFYHFTFNSSGYQWRKGAQPGYYKRTTAAVGKFDHQLLTRLFVEALLRKLEDEGIDPRQVTLGRRSTRRRPAGDPQEVLHTERGNVQRAFEAAQLSAREAKTDRSRASHQDAADVAAQRLDELDALIADSVEKAEATPQELQPDTLEVGSLAVLLSVLLDTAKDACDPIVAQRLGQIVFGGTITGCWDDTAPWATFSCKVRVATDRGVTRNIELSFEMGNTSQGTDREATARRLDRVLELRMTSAITIDELAARLGATSPFVVGRNLQAALREKLVGKGLPAVAAAQAAVALLDCPIDSTRNAIWQMLTDQELPKTVENLDAEQTTRHLEALKSEYLHPLFSWQTAAWSTGGERQRRQIVRWVALHAAKSGAANQVQLKDLFAVLNHTSGTGVGHSHILREDGPTGDGVARLLISAMPPRASIPRGTRQPGRTTANAFVRLRVCPWCEHSAGLEPLPVPEGGSDPVFCPACRRQPSDPSRTFPASYLRPYEGPFGRSRTDSRPTRERGARAGTRIGAAPTMLKITRTRRTRTAQK